MAKHRSPAYPAINLEEAVELVGKLYPYASKHPIGVNVVSEQWGYKGIASAAPQVAALKQFGLLDEKKEGDDRMVRLSPRAKDIAMDRDGASCERTLAVKEAAIHPAIFAEMWGKWGRELPPDGEIRRYLERERDFNPKYVGRVAANYRDTLEFAKLIGNAEEEGDRNSVKGGVAEVDTTKNETDSEASQKGLRVGSLVQWTSQGMQQFSAPLPIARIEEYDGEQYAYFEGKGHAPMSQLSAAEAKADVEIQLMQPSTKPPARVDLPCDGPEVRFPLSGGTNEVLIRLKKPVSKKEFDRITKLLELAEESFVENSSDH